MREIDEKNLKKYLQQERDQAPTPRLVSYILLFEKVWIYCSKRPHVPSHLSIPLSHHLKNKKPFSIGNRHAFSFNSKRRPSLLSFQIKTLNPHFLTLYLQIIFSKILSATQNLNLFSFYFFLKNSQPSPLLKLPLLANVFKAI